MASEPGLDLVPPDLALIVSPRCQSGTHCGVGGLEEDPSDVTGYGSWYLPDDFGSRGGDHGVMGTDSVPGQVRLCVCDWKGGGCCFFGFREVGIR